MGHELWGTPGYNDDDFGGSHFMGTGTFEARTPEEARKLRDLSDIQQGSAAEQQQLEAESREKNPELWGDEETVGGKPKSHWRNLFNKGRSAEEVQMDLEEDERRQPQPWAHPGARSGGGLSAWGR